MSKTAPLPVLRVHNEAALDRVVVHIPEFLGPLVGTPDVEVVVANLPEGMVVRPFPYLLQRTRKSGAGEQLVGADLLEHLQSRCQRASLRLADEKMHVLRHDNVSSDEESVPYAGALQSEFENTARGWSAEKRSPAVTTEGDEVEMTGLMVASESPGHRREGRWSGAVTL